MLNRFNHLVLNYKIPIRSTLFYTKVGDLDKSQEKVRDSFLEQQIVEKVSKFQ